MEEHDNIALDIAVIGNPVLARKAEEIKNIDEKIIELAKRMLYTMYAAPGIGLAAPQVSQSKRLITVDISVGKNKSDLFILINPEIIHKEGQDIMEEGCLSVPGVREPVSRPFQAVIKGITLEGKEVNLEAEGLAARVFCHEIDHLNGKLFIDRLSPLKRSLIRKKFKKKN
ncbi:MAG: peptide deformylase [Candidatus Aminicenantes bacterium]|nr:peptide deformylase [Candidatus Aminicenantes bacterium]